MINWSRTTKKEDTLIIAIAKRVEKLLPDPVPSIAQINMYIAATHIYSGPLDLQQLLNSRDTDVIHDVYGMIYNLNKETGKLLNYFRPRCMK